MLSLSNYYDMKRSFFATHSYSGKKHVILIPVAIILRQDVCIDKYSVFKIGQPLCSFVRHYLETVGALPPLKYDLSLNTAQLIENQSEVFTLINDVFLDQDLIAVVAEHKPLIESREDGTEVLWTFTRVAIGNRFGRKPVIVVDTNVERANITYKEFVEQYKKQVEAILLRKKIIQSSKEVKTKMECSEYALSDPDFYIQFCY